MLCDGFFAAAQHDGVAGFQREDSGVYRHVGPRFVDDADDAERHAHFADAQAVGLRPLGQRFADGIGQAGYVAHTLRHFFDARRGQERRSRIAPSRPELLNVFLVGREDVSFVRFDGVGDRQQQRILFFGREQRQLRRRGAGAQQFFLRGRGGERLQLPSQTSPVRRKVGSDLAVHSERDGVRLASVDDGDVDSGFAGVLRRAQLGDHAAAAELTLAVALGFDCGRQLADHALQLRLLASVGNVEAVDIRSAATASPL